MNPFNPWRKFPNKRPKRAGWYMCTVEVPHTQRYVMELWYDTYTGQWIDNIRQDVFDTYLVYSRADRDKQLYTLPICNRTDDVTHWKKNPRPCYRGFELIENFHT